MTAVTVRGRAFELTVFMAGGASRTGVHAGQFEGSQVMVKGSGFPARGGMALPAEGAETATVGVICRVTDTALRRCTFENAV